LGHEERLSLWAECGNDAPVSNLAPVTMPQLILGVHSGSHGAAAAVFEDYSLKAVVHLERLTM
jgi:hypothetical protein